MRRQTGQCISQYSMLETRQRACVRDKRRVAL